MGNEDKVKETVKSESFYAGCDVKRCRLLPASDPQIWGETQ